MGERRGISPEFSAMLRNTKGLNVRSVRIGRFLNHHTVEVRHGRRRWIMPTAHLRRAV